MKFSSLIVAAALAFAVPASLAVAQTAATTTGQPAAKTTTTPTAKKVTKSVKTRTAKVKRPVTAAKARSEISLACSADANEKKLTGKPRRTFRKSCMAQKAKLAPKS